MVRIRRTGSKPRPQHARDGSNGPIRVSRTRVRDVRISHPADRAEIHGRMVSVSGNGNPWDTLIMEIDGRDPQFCKVGSDGTWRMPESSLPSGDYTARVASADRSGGVAEVRFKVTALEPIAVISPLQGETMEAKAMELTGKASPDRLVALGYGGTTVSQRADGNGSFRFTEVLLKRWGTQRLKLYYAEDPTFEPLELVIKWPGLDLPSLVDPVTRAQLVPGADVVRCANCYTYCYRVTWTRLRRCPRCSETSDYWERSNSSFHTPRVQLKPD